MTNGSRAWSTRYCFERRFSVLAKHFTAAPLLLACRAQRSMAKPQY